MYSILSVCSPFRSEVPHRRTQSFGDNPGGGVTVITIGQDVEAGGILPSVLRDKPRITTTPGKLQPAASVVGVAPATSATITAPAHRPHSSRPDLADVVAVSCTPPPDLGGITNGDERVQIYVPSPQSTPYSTISKHGTDSHKSITFLNYRQENSTVSLDGVQVRT